MRNPRRLSWLLAPLLVAACSSSRSGFPQDDGGGVAEPSLNTAKPPFDRNAACASSVEPTKRAPGAVLIVLDRSFSMNDGPDGTEPRFGDPAKWAVAVSALEDLVDALPDGLELGLEMFPSAIGCAVATAPQVALGDIKVTRASVKSAFGIGANGDTPTQAALRLGIGVLSARTSSGSRAIIFLSDGAPNCGSSTASVESAVADGLKAGVRTHVVGVPGSPYSDFSRLAVVGGTRRDPGCKEQCEATWADTEKCCHYVTSASGFKSSLSAALAQIAAQIRTDCVYQVPRPESGPADPGKVNVLVTVDGKEVLVYQSDDQTKDGWSYTDGSDTSIVIHGGTCAKLLAEASSKVEIAVGCPTEVR